MATATAGRRSGTLHVWPEAMLMLSAVFHYLGPSFAVLLFAYVDVLGVAWLRIVSAAVIFAIWRRPWRVWSKLDRRGRLSVLAWGVVLVLMNSAFYLAVARLSGAAGRHAGLGIMGAARRRCADAGPTPFHARLRREHSDVFMQWYLWLRRWDAASCTGDCRRGPGRRVNGHMGAGPGENFARDLLRPQG